MILFGEDRSNTVSVPFHPFGFQLYRFVVEYRYLLFDPSHSFILLSDCMAASFGLSCLVFCLGHPRVSLHIVRGTFGFDICKNSAGYCRVPASSNFISTTRSSNWLCIILQHPKT